MIKSLILSLIFIVFTTSLKTAHTQYFPSTPGGSYQNTNTNTNTKKNTKKSSKKMTTAQCTQFIQNKCSAHKDNYSTTNVLVDGREYHYQGNFKLVCVFNNKAICENVCENKNHCACLMNQYQSCKGTVKKYNLEQPKRQQQKKQQKKQKPWWKFWGSH